MGAVIGPLNAIERPRPLLELPAILLNLPVNAKQDSIRIAGGDVSVRIAKATSRNAHVPSIRASVSSNLICPSRHKQVNLMTAQGARKPILPFEGILTLQLCVHCVIGYLIP